MTGMPYDGRGRQAPEWVSGDPPDKFESRLVQTVVDTVFESMAPPVIPPEYDQAQARLYHGTWLKNFSFFAWRFPSWLLEIASRCPYQDVRREIIEDCVDEEVGDEDAGGRCHVDVLYEEAEACGITREEIASTEPTPPIHAAILALDDLARALSWEASFAAIAGLEIIQSKPAVEYRNSVLPPDMREAMEAISSVSLPERLGIESENLLFNALHSYKDQFHGGGELKLLVKYGTDARAQREMLWAAKTAVQMFGLMTNEMRRLCIEAVEG
jgi:pyrroloquinoline quinone (PQQ) biosynthesis protein C